MASEKERTLFCGNLSEKVTESLLYELFLQAGPLENVTIPKDKEGRPRRFAFIKFKHTVSVPYTIALMNGIALYGKPLRLETRTGATITRNEYLEKLNHYKQTAQSAVPSNRNDSENPPRKPYDKSSRYDSAVPGNRNNSENLPREPYDNKTRRYDSAVPGNRNNSENLPREPYDNKTRRYDSAVPGKRNYSENLPREQYDGQSYTYDSRRYKSRPETQRDYNQWNAYSSPPPSHHYPRMPVVYPAQSRFQSSEPQVAYHYGNRGNWQRNPR